MQSTHFSRPCGRLLPSNRSALSPWRSRTPTCWHGLRNSKPAWQRTATTAANRPPARATKSPNPAICERKQTSTQEDNLVIPDTPWSCRMSCSSLTETKLLILLLLDIKNRRWVASFCCVRELYTLHCIWKSVLCQLAMASVGAAHGPGSDRQ